MKTIRSLERGLEVLALFDEPRSYGLAEIHQRTGIAKATLLRILLTLEQKKLVWRAIADGAYRRTRGVVPRNLTEERCFRTGELAAPFLERLQKKAIWPSDLLVYRDYKLELVESSRRRSNLGIQLYRVGYRVDLFLSAPGRAFLAFCSPERLTDILDDASRNPPKNLRAQSVIRNELDQILEETRRLGYGGRDSLFGGSDLDIRDYDDLLDAIAVPVIGKQGLIGCMNMVWPRKYRLRAKIVREFLPEMQQTAADIANEADLRLNA
ncbi:MAG: helix-turn-helix domain-containing protein [Rhodocyclaceae bacterium]|nr:helix-turn-helix domain-containing protein [Rhodocyclaceae bacterium]MBX3669452.1 helix-turn-helix domain-containing protein [Rhodocyclaceae bacterium]